MINSKFLSFFLLIGLSFSNVLPIAHYRAIPLENLIDNDASLSKNSITFKYKIFSKADCRKYLGRKQVWDRGFRPIQIHIFNNTDKCLNLCTKNFSFPCIPFNQVADKVYFNTPRRILGWSAFGIFSSAIAELKLSPLCIFGIVSPMTFSAILAASTIAIFTPLALDCFKSPKANKLLSQDYCSKALIDQVIEPGCTANGVIFVSRKQFDTNFSLILNDVASNEQFKLCSF